MCEVICAVQRNSGISCCKWPVLVKKKSHALFLAITQDTCPASVCPVFGRAYFQWQITQEKTDNTR